MDYFNNINLEQNELQNAVVQNLSAAPINPKKGQFYFNTGSNKLLYYNGSRWISATDDGNSYKYTASNPALTASSGICTWTINHGLGNKYPTVQLYEISSGEMVIADITAVSESQLKVIINSTTSISAGTYQAVIIG